MTRRILTRALATGILALLSWPVGAAISITNVATVNVTPSSFSVVASVSQPLSSATPVSISAYSDPAGATNLSGQVALEFYPLNAGDPSATNAYGSFLSMSALRQDSMGLGLIYVRVSDCAPNTTYYYRIAVTNTTNGQSAFWPPSGPLPAATTARENSFVLQSQQLLVTLDAIPPGAIITLTTSNSSSVIAAVVGDGAPTNRAFFNVNDLIAASGGTNYSPVGTQYFTATVQGDSSAGLSENYDLMFSTNFSVGQSNTVTLSAQTVAVAFGSDALLTGTSGSVPITINAQSPLVSLSFLVNLPTALFSSLSFQALSPLLQSSSMTVVSPTSVRFSFTAKSGTNFQGIEQVGQLNFTAASSKPSAIVPLLAQAPGGTNSDATVVGSFLLQPGRLLIIGPQPILDTEFTSAAARNLVLYGIPGDSYEIQSEAALANPSAWSDFMTVPMTNISLVISNLDPTPASMFFRAYLLSGDPPRMQAASVPGQNRSLLVYGLPGTNYTLQVASNLSATVVWHPLLSYTLTNSFQYLTNLGNSFPAFYRIKKQ